MTPRLVTRRSRRWAVALLGAAVMASLGVGVLLAADKDKGGNENAAAASPQQAPAVPEAQVEKVKITFRTSPTRHATVTWGGKRLGVIEPGKPLVVERPRDSGPMDVVIRAAGFLPLCTRAFTFKDGTLTAKITPVDQKNTLFGYREELPPENVPGSPDGGVPAVPAVPAQPGAAAGGAVPKASAAAPKAAAPQAPAAPAAAQPVKPSAAPVPSRYPAPPRY